MDQSPARHCQADLSPHRADLHPLSFDHLSPEPRHMGTRLQVDRHFPRIPTRSNPDLACDRPPHSMTSSARVTRVCGKLRPIAAAVLRLTDSVNLAGSCTGNSAGFSPLRMRST